MSVYNRKLYNNLPLYARLADQEGVLEHICSVLQIGIDKSFRALADREFFFDGEVAPDEWMQFLGQLVALTPQGKNYLGTGINPNWTIQQKRVLLLNTWKYWQKKGTPQGIREAIWLWLGWESALDPTKLHILQPFGDRPTSKPDNWISWGTLYHENLLRTHQEKSFLGAEQIVRYRPNHYISEKLETPQWNRPGQKINLSHLGPENLWLHLILHPDEWLLVFPDILQLLPEVVTVGRKPAVFGWLRSRDFPEPITIDITDGTEVVTEFRTDGFKWGILSANSFDWGGTVLPHSVVEEGNTLYVSNKGKLWSSKNIVFMREKIVQLWDDNEIFDYVSILGIASDAKNWSLKIETDQKLYLIPAGTIFWYKDTGIDQKRSFHFSLPEQFQSLFVEFLLVPEQVEYINSYSLFLGSQIVQQEDFEQPLPLNPGINAGFQFFVPFELALNSSIGESLLIVNWLPILKVFAIRLEMLIAGDPMARLIELPLPPITGIEESVQEFQEVLEQITDQLTILLNGYGDKHFQYTITEPTLSVTIQHQLNKQPSVNFIDAVDGIGNDAIAEITRIDLNTIEIKFSKPRSGRVIFN